MKLHLRGGLLTRVLSPQRSVRCKLLPIPTADRLISQFSLHSRLDIRQRVPHNSRRRRIRPPHEFCSADISSCSLKRSTHAANGICGLRTDLGLVEVLALALAPS